MPDVWEGVGVPNVGDLMNVRKPCEGQGFCSGSVGVGAYMQTAAGSPVGSPQSVLMLTLPLPTILFDAVSSHDQSPEKARQTQKTTTAAATTTKRWL